MTTFEYIRKGFANKEWGGRIIHWIDYRYYFQTLDFGLMDDGRYYFDAIKADEDLKDATLFEERLREVACGVIAEYIGNEHEKTPKQIFEDYYNDCFESYKGRKIHDIELMLKPDDEIELAFVKDMISNEKRRIEASKAIDEYMTDEEKETLAQVGSCFMEYLQNKLNKIKPKQEQLNTPIANHSAKEKTKSRTIKESELAKHFNAKFKGAGNNPNLFNNLIADLKDLTTTSDCSAVALMIWESNTGFINSFSTFAKWCRFFFDCIGVEVKPKYNYSRKVQATNKLKKKFYYL